MTELDVYLIVQNAAMTELGEQVIVYGDFASGPRCAREKGGLADLAKNRAGRSAVDRLLGDCRRATGAISPTPSPSAAGRRPASASYSTRASVRCTRARPH